MKHIQKRLVPAFGRLMLLTLLVVAALTINASPDLHANAIYLLTDEDSTRVVEESVEVTDDKLVVTGAEDREAGTSLINEGEKVTITHDGKTEYATARAGEDAAAILKRAGVSVGPLEMVHIDVSGEGVQIEVASDFTYYEVETIPTSYKTVTEVSYRVPKGETRVAQAGKNGTKEITYEIVYADGQFVSRQAVAETEDNAVTEILQTGTLVKEARSGDTIAEVIRDEDGGGYLIMKSGDSLHFTHTRNVKCTAYTANVGKVGTITATGTRVHTGVVAVDKRVIPLGSRMFITTTNGSYTYGMARVEDTGVIGNVVDLYMNSYGECMQFGARSSVLYFLD